jgi:AcrR family transcriptional regulator
MPRAVATSNSRRGAKWQLRREAIIDTSARLFASRGYHATGISELCQANELGKGALYHYIGSKEELLAAIHDRGAVRRRPSSPSSGRSWSTSSTATPTTCGSSSTSSRP